MGRAPLSSQDLVVLMFAAHRLTRLIAEDDLPPVQAARDKVIAWVGKNSTLAEGLTCPWCCGAHVAWILVCLTVRKPPWRLSFREWMLAAAVSGTTGLLSTADSALGRLGSL